MKAAVVAVLIVTQLGGTAFAAPRIDVHSLILGDEGARYLKGTPTLDLAKQNGAIQVRPLGFDHGSLVFGVAFFNSGHVPANAGIENINASVGGKALRVFTVHQLIKRQKNRAMWSQIGLALLGATTSALAASQRNTYRSTFSTPSGVYRYRSSYPSFAGQVQAAEIMAGTTYGMYAIQRQLDQTIEMLGDQIVQTTTIDPGDSYAGRVIIDKLDSGKSPQELHLDLDWNGERYSFGFLVLKTGQTVPQPYLARLASNSRPKSQTFRAPPTGSVAQAAAPVTGSAYPTPALAPGAVAGAILLRSGAIKVPAKTASGYCLQVPPSYAATGSDDYPVITSAMPVCKG